MSTATSAGTRCASTVVSLLWRALGSLTFGKVLIGAALIWVAAMVGAAGGNAHDLNSVPAANEFTAVGAEEHEIVLASNQVGGDDGSADINDSGVSGWVGQPGVGGAQRVSGGGTASGLLAADPSGHLAGRRRSLGELRAARQQQVADEEPASWPPADGHGHGSDSVATSSASNAVANSRVGSDHAGTLTRTVLGSIRSAMHPALEFVSGLADRFAGSLTSGSGQPPSGSASTAADRRTSAQAPASPTTSKGSGLLGWLMNLLGVAGSSDGSGSGGSGSAGSGPGGSAGGGHAVGVAPHTAAAAKAATDAVTGTINEATDAMAIGPNGQNVAKPAGRTGSSDAASSPAGLSGAAPPGPGVDRLFSGIVDLVSGVVGTVGGQAAGQQTHAALTRMTDQVESALAVGAALTNNAGNTGIGGAGGRQPAVTGSVPARDAGPTTTSRPGGDSHHGAGAVTALASRIAGCASGPGCADDLAGAVSKLVASLSGRGPPAAQSTDTRNTGGQSGRHGSDSVSNTGSRNTQVGRQVENALAQLSPAVTSLIDNTIFRATASTPPTSSSAPTTRPASSTGFPSASTTAALGDGIVGLIGDVLSAVGQFLGQLATQSGNAGPAVNQGSASQGGASQGSASQGSASQGGSQNSGSAGQPAQSSGPGSSSVDQLAQGITELVENCLAQNGLTGTGSSGDSHDGSNAGSGHHHHDSDDADDSGSRRHHHRGDQSGDQSSTGTGQSSGSGSAGPSGVDQLVQGISQLVQSWLAQHGLAGSGTSGSGAAGSGTGSTGATPNAEQWVSNHMAQTGSRGAGTSGNGANSSSALPSAVTRPGPGVDQMFSSLVELGSGVVGAVAGHDAGAGTHQVLSGVADQVESAMTTGVALRRDLGGADSGPGGSGDTGQQWGLPGTRAAQLAGSGRTAGRGAGGSGSSDGMTEAAPGNSGCELEAGPGCPAADKASSTVLAVLRGRGPPSSLNLRNNTIGNISGAISSRVGDQVENAVSRFSQAITSLVDNFVPGPARAVGSKGGGSSRPTSIGNSGNSTDMRGPRVGRVPGPVGDVLSEISQLIERLGGSGSGSDGRTGPGGFSGDGWSGSAHQHQSQSSDSDSAGSGTGHQHWGAGRGGQVTQGSGQSVQPGRSGSTQLSGVAELAQGITQLVQNWLASNGLGTRSGSGAGQSAGTGSSGAPSTGGSGSQVDPAQQLISSIFDLVSRIVSSVAGPAVGQQTRAALSQAMNSQGTGGQQDGQVDGQGGQSGQGQRQCGVGCEAGQPSSTGFQSMLAKRPPPSLLPADDPS
ncbi:MAG TPA: hypothetical protein VH008_35930, partial [Pseudonocardia sp.]|nr:hypothetical protein [Pseudonocardia sp.]